jgi:phospholipid-transporting ATPase
LALCHSIIVENKNGEISYNASSPDELALVNAAKYFGVEFAERTEDNYMIIKYNDGTLKYKLLNIFEFNSDRKRMSVIIKDQNDNIKLICKGADSVIFKRSHSDSFYTQRYISQQLERFGKKGLRTLILAQRNLSKEEYKSLSKDIIKAYASPSYKKELLTKCYENTEKDMEIIGATAIEDCLQDNLVPTLTSFRQIGIKVWMLTGDHPYTAVSIAHSCGLIDSSFYSIIINTNISDEISHKLNQALDSDKKLCLAVTGDALSIIQNESSSHLFELFIKAITKSLSVVCSRVSPKQKAELVLMVKSQEANITTLAIGDGANDVNMITAADVGIGIMGNEGQQAARASDYIIGQFSYLRRLMFVHGREAYRKNSFSVGYVLWKNCLYVIPLLV